MTILRMDNVLLVVDDLEAVKAFFVDLGLELEGETAVEGESVDRLIGLDGVRADHRLAADPGRPRPDRAGQVPHAGGGQGRAGRRTGEHAGHPADHVRRRRHRGRPRPPARATAPSSSARWCSTRTSYRLCYVRGPEGIIVALAAATRLNKRGPPVAGRASVMSRGAWRYLWLYVARPDQSPRVAYDACVGHESRLRRRQRPAGGDDLAQLRRIGVLELLVGGDATVGQDRGDPRSDAAQLRQVVRRRGLAPRPASTTCLGALACGLRAFLLYFMRPCQSPLAA